MITFLGLENKVKLVKKLPPSKFKAFISNKNNVAWIDFLNPSKEEVKVLSNAFNFHQLAIEDCIRVTHLPKIDEFEDHIFIIFHKIYHDLKKDIIRTHELDVFLGKNFIVTFHKKPSETIEYLMQKFQREPKTIKLGPDFILHAIIDNNTDKYFPLLEYWDNKIDVLEENILKGKTKNILPEIMHLKKTINKLKKILEPQIALVNKLARRDYKFISEKAGIYFRDIFDHLMRAHSELDSFRELLTGAFEAHLSIISNKMNETQLKMNKVMQRLTIIATIFMPLTFIVGVYGMNFYYMPELRVWYAYYLVWAIMLSIAVTMVLLFKKKKWI